MSATARPAHGEGREAILQAAVQVVARKGLRGLTYRAVAKEAGVSHALVTYFFPTRTQLIEAAMEMAASRTAGTTLDATRNPTLDAIRFGFPASIEATMDFQAFQYELTLEACRQEDLRQQAVDLIETNIAIVGRYLAALGIEASPAYVRLVYAALDGLVLQQLVYGDREATHDAVLELTRILENLAPE